MKEEKKKKEKCIITTIGLDSGKKAVIEVCFDEKTKKTKAKLLEEK